MKQRSTIRVLVVDDDRACSESLQQLLRLAGDIEVVGEASSAEEAWRLGRVVRPDVVVIDADLPRASCLDAIRQLGGQVGGLPSFVCLAVYPDQHDAAIQAGASCFMRKDGPPRELISAVRRAAASRMRPPRPISNPAKPTASRRSC